MRDAQRLGESASCSFGKVAAKRSTCATGDTSTSHSWCGPRYRGDQRVRALTPTLRNRNRPAAASARCTFGKCKQRLRNWTLSERARALARLLGHSTRLDCALSVANAHLAGALEAEVSTFIGRHRRSLRRDSHSLQGLMEELCWKITRITSRPHRLRRGTVALRDARILRLDLVVDLLECREPALGECDCDLTEDGGGNRGEPAACACAGWNWRRQGNSDAGRRCADAREDEARGTARGGGGAGDGRLGCPRDARGDGTRRGNRGEPRGVRA